MIYHLTLQNAGIIAGLFLVVFGFAGLALPGITRTVAGQFPRSRVCGVVLLTLAAIWCYWLLFTMEMGEFSGFRKPLMFVLPVGFLLVVWFVSEFLAVRALGILYLLAAEPLLEAAFLRYESSRLLVTVLAYVLIVKGLLWVTMPYLLRDQIEWTARGTGRWFALHGAAFLYGAALLVLAFTRY